MTGPRRCSPPRSSAAARCRRRRRAPRRCWWPRSSRRRRARLPRSLDAPLEAPRRSSSARCCYPIDPDAALREGVGPVVDRLAAALERIADALADRDAREAERALAESARRARRAAPLRHADRRGDAARLSLSRRARLDAGSTATWSPWADRARDRDTRALARGATRPIALDDSIPPSVPAARPRARLRRRALRALLDDGDAARRARPRSARSAPTSAARGDRQPVGVHIVGQVRLVAAGPAPRRRRAPAPTAQTAVEARPRGARRSPRTSPRPAGSRGRRVSSAHVHLRLLELAGVVPVHRLPARELVEHPDARLAAAVARLAVAAEGQVRLGAATSSCSPTPSRRSRRSRKRNADFGSLV